MARLATLIAIVNELVASAPDATTGRALAGLQEPLRTLLAVVDARALAPDPPTAAAAEEVRLRAMQLHGATALARAPLAPPH